MTAAAPPRGRWDVAAQLAALVPGRAVVADRVQNPKNFRRGQTGRVVEASVYQPPPRRYRGAEAGQDPARVWVWVEFDRCVTAAGKDLGRFSSPFWGDELTPVGGAA